MSSCLSAQTVYKFYTNIWWFLHFVIKITVLLLFLDQLAGTFLTNGCVTNVFYLKRTNLHVVHSYIGRWTCNFVCFSLEKIVPSYLCLLIALPRHRCSQSLRQKSLQCQGCPHWASGASSDVCTLEQTPARETLLGNPGLLQSTPRGEIVASLQQPLCSEQQSLCNCRLQFRFLQWELQSTGLLSGRPLDKRGRSFLWLVKLMRHILRLGWMPRM